MIKETTINPAIAGLVQGTNNNPALSNEPARTNGAKSPFAQTLEQAFQAADVKLSKHARQRMQSRQIDLNPEDVGRISDAIDTLRGKGGKISLLLMGNTTFVTNVKNRTVITAVDRYGEADKVFTQIDSAAVVEKA